MQRKCKKEIKLLQSDLIKAQAETENLKEKVDKAANGNKC